MERSLAVIHKPPNTRRGVLQPNWEMTQQVADNELSDKEFSHDRFWFSGHRFPS
jgi:hypothetical protein